MLTGTGGRRYITRPRAISTAAVSVTSPASRSANISRYRHGGVFSIGSIGTRWSCSVSAQPTCFSFATASPRAIRFGTVRVGPVFWGRETRRIELLLASRPLRSNRVRRIFLPGDDPRSPVRQPLDAIGTISAQTRELKELRGRRLRRRQGELAHLRGSLSQVFWVLHKALACDGVDRSALRFERLSHPTTRNAGRERQDRYP
jgi:hypothetical protein